VPAAEIDGEQIDHARELMKSGNQTRAAVIAALLRFDVTTLRRALNASQSLYKMAPRRLRGVGNMRV